MDTVFTSVATAAAAATASLPFDNAGPTAVSTAAAAASEATSPALAALIDKNPYILRIQEHGPYGYQPGLWWPMLFTGLYALSGMVHIGEMAATKHWWLIVLVIGCIAEAVGNGVRIYGHFEPKVIDPYIAQQVILVVTPVFFAAIHYAILGRIIELFGQSFTLRYLKPSSIIPLFVLVDLISLGVQGAGSGLAAVAEVNGNDTTSGGNIVVIGLCVQLAAYVCFQILILTFFVKVASSKTIAENPLWTGRFRFFLCGFLLSSMLVLGRSAFRTVEMINGWIGPISTVEWYYYAFDAAPVCAAVILLNVCHPGFVLPSNHREAVEQGRRRRGEDITTGTVTKPRPRSSWFAGAADDGLGTSAEMRDVAVVSSAVRRDNEGGWTRPHLRAGSLASSTLHGPRSDEKSPQLRPFDLEDDDMTQGSFGWSQPQSPQAAGQYRARANVQQTVRSPALTVADTFESGPPSVSKGVTPSPSYETLHYHQHSPRGGSAQAAMQTGRDDGQPAHNQALMPAFATAAEVRASLRPEVQIWSDDADSTSSASNFVVPTYRLLDQTDRGAGASSHVGSTTPTDQSHPFSGGERGPTSSSDATGPRASTISVAKSENDYVYAM
ncbi:unnamed protein product [Parajaminaea phylloscopi]